MKLRVVRTAAIACLSLALVACGSSNNNNKGATAPAQASAAASAASAATAKPLAASASAASATQAASTAAPQTTAVAATAAPAQNVKTGGTLTAGLVADVINLDTAKAMDVYSGYVISLVAEPLFVADQNLKIVGNLVDKVDNPDDKTYIFHMHPGIKFQDGTNLDAEAVRWNLQRHIDDNTSVRHPNLAPIDHMDVVDPLTLKVTTKAPYAPFLAKLTTTAGYIYSPTTFQKLGDKVSTDLTNAGSGPFTFVEWKRDDHITLKKNPNYWRKDANGVQYPYLDQLVFKPVPDENARENGLKSGELDSIENPPPKDIKALQANSDLIYKQTPGIGFNFVSLNTEKEPFNDKLVREALSYAIDRQQFVDNIYFGTHIAGDVEIPPLLPGHVDGPYLKQDITKAKDLLKQAGKDKVSFTFQYRAGSAQAEQIATLIKDQVTAAGFDVTLQSYDFQTLIDNGNKGNYQAFQLGWSGGIDPDLEVYNLFKSGAGFNLSKIKDANLDQLLDQGQQTLDPTKRADTYKQVSTALLDLQPFIITDWATFYQMSHKNVQNYQLGPNPFPLLYEVWKS